MLLFYIKILLCLDMQDISSKYSLLKASLNFAQVILIVQQVFLNAHNQILVLVFNK